MVKLLRKGPVCSGILPDGTPCRARVERAGEHCHVCLERLATSPDADTRRDLAGLADLPVAVCELLGDDPDAEVRLRLAGRDDCPLVVLQRLEGDDDAAVREAATAALSAALSPRVLRQPGREDLFSRAEVEALGRRGVEDGDPLPPSRGRPAEVVRRVRRVAEPAAGPPAGRVAPDDVAALGAGFDAVLARLEAIGDRMSSLEAALTATGERLSVISGHLDELADATGLPEAVGPAAVAATPDGGLPGRTDGLLPVPCPAALDTGAVIRADAVAAAWLAVIPFLARRRAAQRRVAPAAVARDPVAGPFLTPRSPIAAELAPPTSALLAVEASSPAAAGPEPATASLAAAVAEPAAPRWAPRPAPGTTAGRRKPLHAKRH